MIEKNRKPPGVYYLKLFFVIIMLAFSYLADFALVDRYYWLDAAWVLPITASAIWLGSRETLAISLFSLILSLSVSSDATSQLNLWTSAGVGLYGAVMAVVSSQVRRSYARANIVREALRGSPLAYAELSFPGYEIINFNDSLLQLTGAGVTSGSALPGLLDDSAGERLAAILDQAVAEDRQVQAQEFRITRADGRDSYWNISATPVRTIGRRTPGSVALFASEVTDAVHRAVSRDAALRISNAVMSNLDLDETISIALESLTYITDTDAGCLFLLEDGVWVGQDGVCAGADSLPLRIAYEELPAAVESVTLRRSVALEDAAGERRAGKLAGRLGMRSAMVVPLIAGNRAIGAVWCIHTDSGRSFSGEQLEFATVVGAQVALAIDNASIYNNEYSMRKSLEAIESISEAGLTSLDMEEVLIELVTRTQDVMQMDAAMILLLDSSREFLEVRAVAGAVAETASNGRLRVGESLAGLAFSRGEPMKLDDVNSHPDDICPFAAGSGIRSIMAVPLKQQGRTIGVLQTGSMRLAAFSARELGLIQILADRASHAVQNSMLHERTRNELASAALLRDVAAACAGSRDIRKIARQALDAIYNQLGCEIASIYYLDGDEDVLVNLAFMGHSDELVARFGAIPLDRGTFLTQAVIDQQVMTHDTHPTSEASPTEMAILEELDAVDSRRAALPIIYRGESVGGFALTMRGSAPFSLLEIDTFKSIADQLAVALQNSRSADRTDA
ncbi:MAG: GAF domain-containing protein [Gaiellales bacterium]|nr:MAG: GAF domain-containing protein [Gaiellales bacterium]